jgi:hypothetical protein
MMIKRSVLLLITLFFLSNLRAQNQIINEMGMIFKYSSPFTSFPHHSRVNGHSYRGDFFSAEEHYSDSTILVFIPNRVMDQDTVELVFYFHGWWNNIDKSINEFDLINQFSRSGLKGILVFPETALNAPDSFGGKLENKDVFAQLVSDLKSRLGNEMNLDFTFSAITLAGHSGAYRVISYIIMHGGLTDKIKSVYLFDALYGGIEKYTNWINNYSGRFINIYTPEGGTKEESENLMTDLSGWEIPFKLIETDDFTTDELTGSRIIFIKSVLEHNEVIHSRNQFQKFIESSF